MSDEQISLPFFAIVLLVSGLIVRYLFFSGPRPERPPVRTAEQMIRSREVAVQRIQQMFPQVERRSILWDLQRNGGNIQSTTERILAGRLETVWPSLCSSFVSQSCMRPFPCVEFARLVDGANESWLIASYYFPTTSASNPIPAERKLWPSGEAAREACSARFNHAIQPQEQG